jgi:branched-chain amino acid transport system ATP-binding protein
VIELDSVRVRYGAALALRGVSLCVRSGEVVALVGANGAGKSTTLRSIARLVPVESGAIRWGGRDICRDRVEDVVAAGITLAPEGRAIFPNLTVRENLELGAWTHKDRNAMRETTARVEALFPRLRERMRQLGGTLSGGEQQMLAIGRALMARPKLLLLDEPSLGIAPLLARAIFDAIVAIAKSGVTILLVEQNTRLALAVSDRAYVLRTGEVVLEGASRELAEHPDVKGAYLGA